MHLAPLLSRSARSRTRSATLVRRHAVRQRRPRRLVWLLGFGAGLAGLGAALVGVGRAAPPLSVVGTILTGDADHGGTGPIDDGPVPLLVHSDPTGARISIDGRERGRTPLALHTTAGSHIVRLRADATLEAIRSVDLGPDGATADVALWRR
jgi:PEGA domain